MTTTINTLIESSGLSRYYVTKAAIFAGVKLQRGRKPTEITAEQSKTIKKFLKSVMTIKKS